MMSNPIPKHHRMLPHGQDSAYHLAYGFSVLIVLALWIGLLFEHQRDERLALAEFRKDAQSRTVHHLSHLETPMRLMYQGIRTIARLPVVRETDPAGETLVGDNRATIQELYENLAQNITLSEVYILPRDFDPDRIDPRTKARQTPITTFDNLIVGRTAEHPLPQFEPGQVRAPVPEVEIHEYRLMRGQLAWMREHVPREELVDGLSYPVLSGPEVITCDNRRYSPSAPDDKDRSGFVFSVPFYGKDGDLRGAVSAVMLSHNLRDLLPSEHFVVQRRDRDGAISQTRPPTWLADSRFVAAQESDPALLYSEVVPLAFADETGDWSAWTGLPNEAFWTRGDVRASRLLFFVGNAALLVILLGMLAFTRMLHNLARETSRREMQYRTLVESAPEAIVVFDSDTGAIHDCNRNAEQLFGLAREELLGRPFPALSAPDQPEEALARHTTAVGRSRTSANVRVELLPGRCQPVPMLRVTCATSRQWRDAHAGQPAGYHAPEADRGGTQVPCNCAFVRR